MNSFNSLQKPIAIANYESSIPGKNFFTFTYACAGKLTASYADTQENTLVDWSENIIANSACSYITSYVYNP